MARTERELAEEMARLVPPGSYFATVVRAVGRRPQTKEIQEIFEGQMAGVPGEKMINRLKARDAKKKAARKAPGAPPVRAKAALRLAGEAAALAERDRQLAEQPPGALCLHPDAVAAVMEETSPVIVTDGRGVITHIEHRRRA